jgi:imidazolonepropionase-like amidohydrolase
MRALRAAQLFDGTAFLGAGTVLVDGERIVGVEPGYAELPGDVDVTTYTGTLLPGLVDCHVHLVSNGDLGALERAGAASDEELDAQIRASLAANGLRGITTVADLGDRAYRTLEARALPGLPRVRAAGPPLTVPDGHCHFLGGVAAGVDGVRDQVAEHVIRGVDVLKVMASGGMITVGTDVLAAQFSNDELAAVVAAGHQAGLKVLAHAHALAGVWHAIRAGVDGIEHFSCLTETGWDVSEELLEAVSAAGVTIDLTLGFDLAQVPPTDTLPPGIRAMMERTGLDFRTMNAERLELAGRIRAHGIRLVTGTDAGAAPPKRHGGTALAIQTLVEAGYPVAEAVGSATSVASEYLGLAGETGTLRAGLAADLLVVDGDLATDPGALSRPVAVLIRGTAVVG